VSPLQSARDLLASVPDDPMRAVELLSRVREAVDAALDEAMARAALEGASFRSVASRAGLAPNSVAPRLARTAALSPYADPAGRESRANLRSLAAELKARSVLGLGVSQQEATDTIHALATDESVFRRLTRECGWTPTATRPHRPHPQKPL
jgi:hypothetical protein